MAKAFKSPEEELEAIKKKEERLAGEHNETMASLAKCKKRIAELEQQGKR